VRRQKNDARRRGNLRTDAAFDAVCCVRSLENQAALMKPQDARNADSQRTQLINGLRGHLAEVAVIAAQGPPIRPRTGRSHRAGDEAIPLASRTLAPS